VKVDVAEKTDEPDKLQTKKAVLGASCQARHDDIAGLGAVTFFRIGW